VKYGTVAARDLELFSFADSPESAMELLKRNLTYIESAPDAELPAISHSAKPDEA
jgi:hypothetical protein